MLYHGNSATWLTEGSKSKQRSDLIFVKDTMANFQKYYLDMEYDGKTFERMDKDLKKSFEILAKYMWGLWD